jgi:hypothetical protein
LAWRNSSRLSRAPHFAVLTKREVANHDVRVQERIAGARRAVGERRRDEPLPADLAHAVLAAAPAARLNLEVVECLPHRRVVRGARRRRNVLGR